MLLAETFYDILVLIRLCLQYLAGISEDFEPSSTVILRGVGTAVLEADIRRLVPRKIHFPNLRDDNDVVRGPAYPPPKTMNPPSLILRNC
jgi:hypothetical protein